MIAYFDTSAIVPLLIDEPGTARCREHWLGADRLISVRLAYAESRAALAHAARTGRINRVHLRRAVEDLHGLLVQLEFVEVDDDVVRGAGDLSESHALRAYDAVHLAAALAVAADDLVLVAGDRALLAAAREAGLTTAAIG